jgi:hypothetical protein
MGREFAGAISRTTPAIASDNTSHTGGLKPRTATRSEPLGSGVLVIGLIVVRLSRQQRTWDVRQRSSIFYAASRADSVDRSTEVQCGPIDSAGARTAGRRSRYREAVRVRRFADRTEIGEEARRANAARVRVY